MSSKWIHGRLVALAAALAVCPVVYAEVSERQEVRLDYRHAPLSAVVESMSSLLDRPVMLNPALDNTLIDAYCHGTFSLDSAEVEAVLRAILAARGISLVASEDGKSLDARVLRTEAGPSRSADLFTHILLADHAAPANLAKSLKILGTSGARIDVIEAAKLVVITDTREGLQSMLTPAMVERDKLEVTTASEEATSAPGDGIGISRQALMSDLMKSYQELTTLKPEIARDADGKLLGITAQNISSYPVFNRLGFVDGDIVQTVNNEQITSEAHVAELFTKYQNSNSFRIGIIRDGKPKVVTYRLD